MAFPFIKRRNPVPLDTILFDFDEKLTNRGYLREIAINTVIGHIARTVAQSTFQYIKDGERQYDDIDYMLNVRPNTSQSAFEFWQHFVYTLITKNEVLAFVTDDKQLIVADSFSRNEYALLPDTFSNVTYKNFTYQRNFSEDDVLFLQFNNTRVLNFMNKVYEDYAQLYNNMYMTQLRNNQVRGVLNIDINAAQDDRTRNNVQELVNRIFKSVSEKSVSIIPLYKGFKYEEFGNGVSKTGSTDDLMNITNGLVNELADILGVPRDLIHGNSTTVDTATKTYIKFRINPLNKMIEDELNAKLIGKQDYMNGERIKIKGIRVKEFTESAEAIDKLISSGAFTGNEIREEFGKSPSQDPNLDRHYITKNYQTLEESNSTLKGGEK